jgi:hypothetical protein
MSFAAGQILTAADLNLACLPGTLVARHRRTTASTAAAAIQGVATLAVPVATSRLYKIQVPQIHANSTVSGDVVRVQIHFVLGGAVATGSPVLPGAQAFFPGLTAGWPAGALSTSYVATGTGTLNLMITTFRQNGTGNVNLFADGTRCTDLEVWDMGVDPGSSGANI